MKVKLGAIITEASGSLGGHTAQNSTGGCQLRTKPIPMGKHSASQSLIRSYNPVLQAGWRALTTAQQKIWNDWPVSHGIMNAKGDKHPLSGHSLWMKYQFYQLYHNLPFLFDPSFFHTSTELINSWLNDAGYPYNPFIFNGSKILNAVAVTPVSACESLPSFQVQVGDRFLCQSNYRYSSNSIHTIGIVSIIPYRYVSNIVNFPALNFSHVFTISIASPAAYFYVLSYPVNSIFIDYISLKKLL